MDIAKRRSDRIFQQKHRTGRRSYVTELENLQIVLAWEAGELTEGQASKALGMTRIEARGVRLAGIKAGRMLFDALASPSPSKRARKARKD